MSLEGHRKVISYNGEVYNFRELRRELEARGRAFRSRTDTEVVLHLLDDGGEKALSRLDGMFALGLWDTARRELTLARDRWGQKPLFYAEVQGGLAFASEIKALLLLPGLPRELDVAALDAYLATNAIPAPLSAYRSIRRLEPGSALIARWTDAGLAYRVHRFTPPRPASVQGLTFQDAVEEADRLLGLATRRQLVADVPVGIFLSGGIDSTLLLAQLAALNVQCDAFTAAPAAATSELPFAKEAATALGARLHAVPIEPKHYMDPDRLVLAFDEPFADVAAPAVMELARAARTCMTVALTGDGGDEAFGGYESHVAAQQLARIGAGAPPWRAVASFAKLIPNSATHRSVLRALRRGLPLLAERPAEAAKWLRANLRPADRAALLRPDLRASLPENPWSGLELRKERAREADPLDALFDPLADRMLSDLFLHKTDIASMWASLECRTPFLDNALVDFASTLPRNMHVRGLTGKRVLRTIVERRVKGKLGRRRKTGFSPPVDLWLRGPLLDVLRDRLEPDQAAIYEYLQPREVRRRIREHLDRKADHKRVLWSLVMLESFLRSARPPTQALANDGTCTTRAAAG
jgi:asparagine synthase (glutamine-hydrolysing)